MLILSPRASLWATIALFACIPAACIALFLGAALIGWSGLFVRWSETGPTATGFYRLAIAAAVLHTPASAGLPDNRTSIVLITVCSCLRSYEGGCAGGMDTGGSCPRAGLRAQGGRRYAPLRPIADESESVPRKERTAALQP